MAVWRRGGKKAFTEFYILYSNLPWIISVCIVYRWIKCNSPWPLTHRQLWLHPSIWGWKRCFHDAPRETPTKSWTQPTPTDGRVTHESSACYVCPALLQLHRTSERFYGVVKRYHLLHCNNAPCHAELCWRSQLLAQEQENNRQSLSEVDCPSAASDSSLPAGKAGCKSGSQQLLGVCWRNKISI